MRTLCFLMIGALASTNALADDMAGHGYFGAAMGIFDYSESVSGFGTLEDSAVSYRLYGGWRFSERFAIEGGLGQTGDLEWSDSIVDPVLGAVSASLTADYSVKTVRAMFFLPVSSVNLFAGLGLYDADTSVSFALSAPGVTATGSADGSDDGATLLTGLEWGLMDSLTFRGEFEWFDTESSVDAYNLSLALHYRF